MTVNFDYLVLAPALAPVAATVVALLLDVIFPRLGRLLWALTALGALAGLGAVGWLLARGEDARTLCVANSQTCYWQADRTGLSLQATALAATFVVALLAGLDRRVVPGPARAVVRSTMVSAATAGCVGVIAARDLGSWLVLIELATIPSIALVALRGGQRAVHGALSLLVTALVSFAVQVLGAAMWFAATGSVLMAPEVVTSAFDDPARRPLIIVAMMLILAGVGFKLSLAPFHAWTPEAFAGSGAWVAAFLATTSKVGALGGMLVVLRAAVPLGSSTLVPLAIVAAVSMTVGNLMALRQSGTLRLMAWSSVAQAGWVVLPMTALAPGSVSAAGAYVALYTVGTLAVFVVLAALEDSGLRGGLDGGRPRQAPDRGAALTDVRGLFRTHPVLAGTLALGLLSLAGLPPSVVGLVAKVVALKPAVTGGVWWLVIIAALNAVLGVAVYGRWIMMMFARPASADSVEAGVEDGTVEGVAGRVEELTDEAQLPMPRGGRAYTALAALTSLGLIAASLAPQLLLAAF